MKYFFIFQRMDLSGGPQMAYHFVSALISSGHDVAIACRNEPERDGIELYSRLQALGARMFGSGIPGSLSLKFLDSIKSALLHRPQLVIAVYPADLPLCTAISVVLNIPILFYDQNRKVFSGSYLVSSGKLALLSLLTNQPRISVLCVSPAIRDELIHPLRVDPLKLQVLLPGIDIIKCKRKYIQPKVSADEIRFINVGRIDHQKSQLDLILAFSIALKTLRNARLIIIGGATLGSIPSAEYYSSCLALINELGISDSVELPGWCSNVPELLAQADVYVHSARWEGFPLSVMEAMATGLPTIFTDCSGVPSGLNVAVVRVVRAASPSELAQAMIEVGQMTPQERYRMGECCRKNAETIFDIKNVKVSLVGSTQSILSNITI